MVIVLDNHVWIINVSKDMKKRHNKWGGGRKNNGTFMCNINCQGIEN